MVTAQTMFSAADRQAIAAAVATAERSTAGEIVPVVAARSDGYERAADHFGLLFACLAFAAVWMFGQRLVPGGDWDQEHDVALPLSILLLVIVGGFYVGVMLANAVPALHRLLLPRAVAKARVLVAAQQAFETLHVRRTAASTGVVLYVSLFEREVAVVADRAVADKVDAVQWATACKLLVDGLRRGEHSAAFVAAIAHVGKVLAAHFPPVPGDRNELGNDLHVLG